MGSIFFILYIESCRVSYRKRQMVMAKLIEYKESTADLKLSVSKVKTFKDCKAKFLFCYIEKLPRKDWEYHVFGKFMHEILERYYKFLLEGCQDKPNVILTRAWKDSFQNWKEKLTPDHITEAKQICGTFLQKLVEEKDSQPAVIAAERSFYIDIDGKVLLNGFIDRIQIDVDGVLHVTDYKTTKNKKYLKNDFFQLLTYAFVMCLEDPTIKKVRASYILLRHDFEMLVKDFSREEIMSVEQTFLEYAEKINAEKLYRPSPSKLCDYCDYLEVCEAGQRVSGKIVINENSVGESDW